MWYFDYLHIFFYKNHYSACIVHYYKRSKRKDSFNVALSWRKLHLEFYIIKQLHFSIVYTISHWRRSNIWARLLSRISIFLLSMIFLLNFGPVLAVWYFWTCSVSVVFLDLFWQCGIIYFSFFISSICLYPENMISLQSKKWSNHWNIHQKNSNDQIHLNT